MPSGDLVALGAHRMTSATLLAVWAVEGDLDATATQSNTFEPE